MRSKKRRLARAAVPGALANIGACRSVPHPNGAVKVVWHGGVLTVLALMNVDPP